MEKKKIYPRVFHKNYEQQRAWIPVDDIPIEFLQHGKNYKINIEKVDEAYYSDSSHDAYTYLEIIEERLQTDEERDKYKKEMEIILEERKKDRHRTYLALKKEFE